MLVDIRPNPEARKRQQAFAQGSCSGSSVFAGQVNYFEHYSRIGQPTAEAQTSPKGLFSSALPEGYWHGMDSLNGEL